MKLLKILVIVVITPFILNSCTTRMGFNYLSTFDKGMEITKFQNQADDISIDVEEEFDIPSSQIGKFAKVFVVKEFIFKERSKYLFFNLGSLGAKNYYDYNLFIFIDNKLTEFGKFDDLNRNPDKNVRNIAYQVAQKLK